MARSIYDVQGPPILAPRPTANASVPFVFNTIRERKNISSACIASTRVPATLCDRSDVELLVLQASKNKGMQCPGLASLCAD